LFRRKRRGKELDVVSTAIPGGEAAGNAKMNGGKAISINTLYGRKTFKYL